MIVVDDGQALSLRIERQLQQRPAGRKPSRVGHAALARREEERAVDVVTGDGDSVLPVDQLGRRGEHAELDHVALPRPPHRLDRRRPGAGSR